MLFLLSLEKSWRIIFYQCWRFAISNSKLQHSNLLQQSQSSNILISSDKFKAPSDKVNPPSDVNSPSGKFKDLSTPSKQFKSPSGKFKASSNSKLGTKHADKKRSTRSSCVVSTGVSAGLPVVQALHTTTLWYCT